ncbi:hypothetical protein THAOC_30333, partial [Thalassiosira oceanica]
VINGKGQGVQRLKGNADYRKAVKAHKVGPLRDVREEQGEDRQGNCQSTPQPWGRFLKLNERTGVYSELGNAGKQGAVEKTSQALREKQTALMMQIRAYESSEGDIPKTQFSDEEFYQYSLHVFASIHGEPMSELPAPVKAMVEISNLEADFGARPDRDEISCPAPLAPVNSRHAMVLATARDQHLGIEPGKSRKHRMPAAESLSWASKMKKRAKISVESTRNDFLHGPGIRSNHRPGNVHWQEVSHSNSWKKSSQVLLRDRLPKGILKNAHGKAIDALYNESDVADTNEALNLASSLLDLSDRACTSSSRPPSLAKCDRISTGEYTKLMKEPTRTLSGKRSTYLSEAGTGSIPEPFDPSIQDGQMPNFGSFESDTKDQEPSKTRGQLAKEKKINKKLNTWAEMSSSSVLVRLAQVFSWPKRSILKE